MSVFVTDTHPLLWFTLNQQRNLSPLVLRRFDEAAAGRAYIHIPSMVLYEVAILERLGRIKLNVGFLQWTANLLANDGFGIAELEPAVIGLAAGYGFNQDPFDRRYRNRRKPFASIDHPRRSDYGFGTGRNTLVSPA